MRGHGLSKKVMGLFLDTPDVGPLDDAHGEGWGGSLESGRFIRIQVRLDHLGCVWRRPASGPTAARRRLLRRHG